MWGIDFNVNSLQLCVYVLFLLDIDKMLITTFFCYLFGADSKILLGYNSRGWY
jgi:hypothetical protein